jgi:cytochrome P450
VQNQSSIVDFSDPAMLAEPHAYLAKLRSETPIVRARGPEGREFFVVTSYRLIEEITKRIDDFSNDIAHLLFAGGSASPEVVEALQQDAMRPGMLLITDDPEHKRYRALVNAVFAQGRIAHLAPNIERVVDDLIDDFIEDGECDFVNQFAVLLPTYMIADILGLQRQDYPLVRKWSDATIGIVSRMGSAEEELAAANMVLDFRRFLINAVDERREKPADDLISSLIQVRVEGMEPLTNDEIAPITFEIAVAGNETTRNTMMSGLVRLVKNPDQMQLLIDDPSLTANAIEELLRYETPATSMWRIAAHDTSVGGVDIPKGSEILLRFDAANRDPAVFEDPDKFDVRRKNALRHISFGAPGVHRCLGQMLGRKELQIALPKLLDRLKNLRVIEDKSDTKYWPGLLHRGIGSLRIAFDPGPKIGNRNHDQRDAA